jgi:hypothetical protein
VSLQKRMPCERAYRLAQRRGSVFLESAEEIAKRAPAVKKMEDGGGKRVGRDAPPLEKILENKLVRAPVRNYERRAAIADRVPMLLFRAHAKRQGPWSPPAHAQDGANATFHPRA